MYAVPALTVDSLTRKDISAAEFPRQQLIFREKLGEGQFGEVSIRTSSINCSICKWSSKCWKTFWNFFYLLSLNRKMLTSLVMFIPTCLLQVHLCEAEGLPEFLGEGSPLPDRDGRSVLVAVKQLRADATSQARYTMWSNISDVILSVICQMRKLQWLLVNSACVQKLKVALFQVLFLH